VRNTGPIAGMYMRTGVFFGECEGVVGRVGVVLGVRGGGG